MTGSSRGERLLPVTIDVFGEDAAHARVLDRLVARVGGEEGFAATVRVRAARGGHARALNEYEVYQRRLAGGVTPGGSADVIVVAVDGNCTSFSEMRSRIEDRTRDDFRHLCVPACPDPHVERWIMADPQAFAEAVGLPPTAARDKCERGYYKRILAEAVRNAGHPGTLGGFEFLPDIVGRMDLFRAGKNDASLKAFVGDLRARTLQEGAHGAAHHPGVRTAAHAGVPGTSTGTGPPRSRKPARGRCGVSARAFSMAR